MTKSPAFMALDNDSYLNYLREDPAQDTFEDFIGSLLVLDGDLLDRRDLVYFVLRSIASVSANADQNTLEEHKKWRDFCIRRATILSTRRDFIENPPLPTWALGAVEQVREQLRPMFPQVDSIEVITTFDPRLYVRAYHSSRQIHVSLVTRELLRLMNMFVWNTIDAVLDRPDSRAAPSFLRYNHFLPYFLPLYHRVSWGRIPMLRVGSKLAARGAMTSARLQMTFMIAHEFAHLLLHDEGRTGPELEIEADKFAYDVLFRSPGTDISVGDIWMSVRWLFEVLALERLTAWRLSGSNGIPRINAPQRQSFMHPFVRSVGPSIYDLKLGGTGLKQLIAARRHLEERSAEEVREHASRWQAALNSDDAGAGQHAMQILRMEI
ncbi:ImmA/IrrE family metallo-endopeptidase [Streptomyces griseorubiginosus]|uniref:ImmA/IrrE family metallo-endopeptidase n=1 Tax=Streptomyces griseorubiginosus TaxID=67304 RepID=UPI0036E03F3D